ncbi:MAG UNVERIFIED_CONTAM: hypothetical protein LVR18_23095 [Planctomycetaceae bacterium]|jgi:hypothetical protein
MLRACSSLTGVEIGEAKELYRRFRRLGVYEWRDVLRTAGAPTGSLMALEFTDTELFTPAIGWAEIQSIMEKHKRHNHRFLSPLENRR